MKIIVLGATGFIGRSVVAELLRRNHQVVAVGRRSKGEAAAIFPANPALRYVRCDLYQPDWGSPRDQFGDADLIIDLVWPGLPNYRDMFHIESNLPNSYRMLKTFVNDGYSNLLVAGTCYEYGLQNGPLTATTETHPAVAYAVAKDCLRQWLSLLQKQVPFHLRWCRFFFLFGDGQSGQSLIPQLKTAIANGDKVFNMSGGEQLRDFLPVKTAAEYLVNAAELPPENCAVNICSGQPISVRRLVEQIITEEQSEIQLNLGYFPYPGHEPMAFWGVPHSSRAPSSNC